MASHEKVKDTGYIKWNDLIPNIDKQLLTNLLNSNFLCPTPIQQKTIPALTSNKDVNVKALTGSGKTLAFLVPVITILLREYYSRQKWNPQQIGALILTPTRELAQQIQSVLSEIISNMCLTSLLMVGGRDVGSDLENFQHHGANILIATPGRLDSMLDKSIQISQNSFSAYLRYLEVLIFDEADRLLDMGFTESISSILKYIPKQRRTGLFSATRSQKLADLLKAGLRNPVDISLTDYDQEQHLEIDIPSTLNNYFKICDLTEKMDFLFNFLEKNKENKILLFFATTNCVDYFGGTLKRVLRETAVFLLHGKLKKRCNSTLNDFSKSKKCSQLMCNQNKSFSDIRGILICSDLLARGIDIPNIDWVIQFEPPNNVTTFIHRIGRTARMGGIGNSLILLSPDEDTFVHFLKINQKISLTELDKEVNQKKTFLDVPTMLRDYSLTDRDMYLKGIKAFVSYVRFYQEHQLNHIFNLKNLDLCQLALSFGLLHLPSMPEMKKVNRNNFKPVIMDYESIPFKDKNRQRERQKYLDKAKSSQKIQSNDDDKPDVEKVKKFKRNKKPNLSNSFHSKRHKLTTTDFLELDDDSRVLKRIKKGKLSKDTLKDVFE